MRWLFKEDPSHYSFDDLVRDKKTSWSGVHNNLALKYLRSVKKGDLIFFYHTEKEKQIVATMRAIGDAHPLDQTAIEKSKEVAVDVEPIKKLEKPVTLQSLKGDKRFKDFPLVKFSRLSVLPVTHEQWKLIQSLAKQNGG